MKSFLLIKNSSQKCKNVKQEGNENIRRLPMKNDIFIEMFGSKLSHIARRTLDS